MKLISRLKIILWQWGIWWRDGMKCPVCGRSLSSNDMVHYNCPGEGCEFNRQSL